MTGSAPEPATETRGGKNPDWGKAKPGEGLPDKPGTGDEDDAA